ncbi:SixA phosphatase family protein [Georgenia faecalis]|uniref:SixA phosphatase family protein n=1 Tax=Georgenia faecalis TaxID=2483799 RepID=A0ABV9DEG7_9MICO|nr:histidine phosphatase family protein [Georgenia faecalis]
MTTRRLVLLRHAAAEHEGDLGDAMRPLSAAGRRQAGAVGPLLEAATGGIDLALVSTALRTRETYRILATHLSAPPRVVESDAVYEAGARSLLALLREVPEDTRCVLVVGHEPTMSTLAHLLAGSGREDLAAQVSLGMSTASAAVLEVEDWASLDRSAAALVDLVRSPGQA